MTISKKATSLGMPWEKEYGYAQALQVQDTVHIPGQVSHDDKANIVGRGNMELQMRQAYANIKKVLAEYKATTVSPFHLHRRAVCPPRNITARVSNSQRRTRWISC